MRLPEGFGKRGFNQSITGIHDPAAINKRLCGRRNCGPEARAPAYLHCAYPRDWRCSILSFRHSGAMRCIEPETQAPPLHRLPLGSGPHFAIPE
jgi:hypothetical protein